MEDLNPTVPTYDCRLCFFTYPLDFTVYLRCEVEACKEFFCYACSQDWAQAEAGKKVPIFSCICGHRWRVKQLEGIVEPNHIRIFEKRIVNSALAKMDDVVYCPGFDCEMAYIKPLKKKRVCCNDCSKCKTKFCCQCGVFWNKLHIRKTCKRYAAELEKMLPRSEKKSTFSMCQPNTKNATTEF